MSRKAKIIFLLFAVAYLSYHLFTLAISPLPWFDETFFTSVSHTYLDSGMFQAKIAMVLNNGREIVVYGPLYFWLTAFSIKILGFGIFQFRIICLLFGFMMLIVFYFLIPSEANKIFFLVIFAFDTIVHSGMHGGRMDTLAVSFVLLCIYFFLRSGNSKFYQNIFLSGLFAAAALLTTPRSGVFFIPVGLLFLYRFLFYRQKKYFIGALIWLIIVLSFYAPWYVYAFGSFDNFLLHYRQVNDLLTAPFFIPKHQYPLIIISIMAILYGIVIRRDKYFTEINIISVFNILLFYFFLNDTGAYSIFIVPFYYLLIADGFGSQKMSFKNWKVLLTSLLLVFSLCIFIVKSLVIFSDRSHRQPAIADKFIADNIPPGKKVIGDEMFYYSVIKSGSDFQYIDWYGTNDAREKFQREKYGYEYIVWTNRLEETDPSLLKLYSKNAELKQVGALALPSNNLYTVSRLFGLNVSGSYNCQIYKRIK